MREVIIYELTHEAVVGKLTFRKASHLYTLSRDEAGEHADQHRGVEVDGRYYLLKPVHVRGQ